MAGAMATPRAREGIEPRRAKAERPAPVVPPLPDEGLAPRQQLFDNIFSECSPEVCKQASLAERESEELTGVMSLTYGEMDLRTMHYLLNVVKRDHGTLHSGRGIFLDLGSGVGKAVIAAGLLHPFQRVVGVEQLQSLSDMAVAAEQRYSRGTVRLPERAAKPEAQFLRGDFVELLEGQELQLLVQEVAICLAVSTCYNDEQMEALARFARKMAAGSFIITFTQALPDSLVSSEVGGWTLVHREVFQVMWGQTTVFIFKKVPVTEAAGPG